MYGGGIAWIFELFRRCGVYILLLILVHMCIIPLQCQEKQLRVSVTSVSIHLSSETLVCSFTRFLVPEKQEALQFVHELHRVQAIT